MATNQHETQGSGDSLLSKLKKFLGSMLDAPKYAFPAHSIKSVECENDIVYKVNLSLTYAYSTPSIVNTFTKTDELIYVENEDELDFVPQVKSHHHLDDRIIEDCRKHVIETYGLEIED